MAARAVRPAIVLACAFRACPRVPTQRLSPGRAPAPHVVCRRSSVAMAQKAAATIVGPTWALEEEYPGLASDRLKKDLSFVENETATLETICAGINVAKPEANSVDLLVTVSQTRSKVEEALRNVSVYANCILSVDGNNAEGKQIAATCRRLGSKLSQALTSHSLVLKLCPDELAEKYLAEIPHERFRVKHARKLRNFVLPPGEESLLTALTVDGFTSWGQLYTTLSSSAQCTVNGTQMGVAKAAGLLSSADRAERRAAWEAIQAAWRVHEEAAAAILNSLAGWRIEVNAKRSAAASKKLGSPTTIHYLDGSLHANRMSKKTLDAMMSAITAAKPVGQRALRLQARALKVPALHPCDLLAPPPAFPGAADGPGMPYPEGLDTVAQAVGDVDGSIGEFVRMMAKRRWIEGSEGDAKRPGAYCTMFSKSRAPRVYLSAYNGSLGHVSTLAHELGHAYHNWVMKDMPLEEAAYPMNLAETASIIVGDALLGKASSAAEQAKFGWNDADSCATFLLNIPARFDFECALYEARLSGRTLTPADFCTMMTKAWKDRYGDALEAMDPMFWASKLHFHLTGTEFYNYAYSFGYLFALGVCARREELGPGFHKAYVDLLRDTGRMSAEDVVAKHLKVSIEDEEFWRGSIRIVERKLDAFEAALVKLGL